MTKKLDKFNLQFFADGEIDPAGDDGNNNEGNINYKELYEKEKADREKAEQEKYNAKKAMEEEREKRKKALENSNNSNSSTNNGLSSDDKVERLIKKQEELEQKIKDQEEKNALNEQRKTIEKDQLERIANLNIDTSSKQYADVLEKVGFEGLSKFEDESLKNLFPIKKVDIDYSSNQGKKNNDENLIPTEEEVKINELIKTGWLKKKE